MPTDFEKMIEILQNEQNPADYNLGAILVGIRHDDILEETFDEISIHNSNIIFSFHQDTGRLSHVYP